MKPDLVDFDMTRALAALKRTNFAFAELAVKALNFPACPACLLRSPSADEKRAAWESIPARAESWAFFGPQEGEIEEALGMSIQPTDSTGFFQPWPPSVEETKQVYGYVLQLMRCWASQGASPREIQKVLNEVAEIFKLPPHHW